METTEKRFAIKQVNKIQKFSVLQVRMVKLHLLQE